MANITDVGGGGGTTGGTTGQYFSYTIQPGDTLSAIAARFGTTVDQLAALNGIADPNLIIAGRMLQVPYTGVDTGQAAVPEVTGGGGITPYTPTTTTTPSYTTTPTTTIGAGGLTLNPDVATVDKLRQVLRQMGWGGNYNDVSAMVNAYNSAWMQSPQYTGGTTGTTGYATMGAENQYTIQLRMAEMENLLGQAQLALDERRFEEYDLIMLQIRQKESEIDAIATEAGYTGYWQGTPTLAREELTATIDYQQQQLQLQRDTLTEQIRQFDQQIALAKQEAEEARRQFNETLAWQKEQEAGRLQLERDRLAQELQIAETQIAWYREQQANQLAWEREQWAGEEALQAGALTGWYQGQPTIEMAELMGNPRNLAQTLTLMGYSPAETAAFLQSTPAVQQLTGYPGVSFASSVAPGGVTTTGATGAGATTGVTGRNPEFPFITGQQLPVRQALQWLNQSSPMVDLISGLASYSGQTPEEFWSKFQAYLPKGTTAPTTRVV